MGRLLIFFLLNGCVTTANRDQSITRTRLGTAYLREQNIPGAIGILQEATKLDPRNAEA